MIWKFFLPFAVFVKQFCRSDGPVVEVEIVTLGITYLGGFSSLPFTGPAIDTAIAELRETYNATFSITHTYLTNENVLNCAAMIANSDAMLSKWYYSRTITANITTFISPTCLEFLNVNRLASSWNMLMITSIAASNIQRKKELSPTWIAAVSSSAHNYDHIFINILLKYNWTSMFVVFDQDSAATYAAMAMSFETKRIPNKIPDSQCELVHVQSKSGIDYEQILSNFKKVSRVLIILAHSTTLRTFMLHAARANMTNGEYVYAGLQISNTVRDFGNFSWQYGDPYDAIAREAYRSVLIFGADDSIYHLPADDVVNSWKVQALEKYNYTYGPGEQINAGVIATYLAFLVFGKVLNETIALQPDFPLDSGSEFAKLFLNRTFDFNFTSIYIDEVGERNTNLTVKDLNFTTGTFEVVWLSDQASKILEPIAAIDWGGLNGAGPPLNEPVCGYLGDDGPCAEAEFYVALYPSVATVFLVGLFIGAIASTYCIRKQNSEEEWKDGWWLVAHDQLSWKVDGASRSSFHLGLIRSEFHEPVSSEENAKRNGGRARYKELEVWTYSVENCDRLHRLSGGANSGASVILSEGLLLVLKTLLGSVLNENVNKFMGVCCSPYDRNTGFFVSAFCHRGTIHDLFRYPHFDGELRSSLVMGLVGGMDWIHASPLQFHGRLTGWNCLIDKHFTLKISEFGFDALWRQLTTDIKQQRPHKTLDIADLFWTAPELLRHQSNPDYRKVDVYAVGIIMNEIISGRLPYSLLILSPEDIVERICKGGSKPLRPLIQPLDWMPRSLETVIEGCWEDSPKSRLTMSTAKKLTGQALRGINENSSGLIDRILNRLEAYAETLEAEVSTRSHALMSEREKCDILLCEMLPRKVVEELRAGIIVEPETFDSVTVMFNNITGFPDRVASMKPLEVTNLLNTIYNIFDDVLNRFDVYKVETIGEVYMVASGLPTPNGRYHVKEICSLALAFRLAFRDFSIASEDLSLRSGVNSGPCVAGIVGHRKPRYCLFGDTINSASRMESSGLADKIQISSATEVLLRQFSRHFKIIERGFILVKGKGQIITYWLENFI